MPTNPKVGLAMIARNKADIIERVLDSTKGVFDFYALQDTGSTDKTTQVFTNWCTKNDKAYTVGYGRLAGEGDPILHTKKVQDSTEDGVVESEVNVYGPGIYPFVEVDGKKVLADFGAARNDSFDLLRNQQLVPDLDYGFWVDTDDVLIGSEQIPALLEFCKKHKINQVILEYIYGRGPDGLKAVTQQRERLIDLRKPGKWVNRVHEHYAFDGPVTTIVSQQLQQAGFNIFVQHERTPEESLTTNRRNHLIMKQQLDELGIEKLPDEVLAHMAYDHWEHREFEECLNLYRELIARYEAQNAHPEMRFQVYMKMAQAYRAWGKNDDAASLAFTAAGLTPNIADPYLILAEIALERRQLDEAEYYANKVLAIGRPNTTAAVNEYDYYITPRRLIMAVAIQKNDIPKALKMVEEMMGLMPTNAQIKQEYFGLEYEQKAQRAQGALGELGLYLQATNRIKDLDKLISLIPIELRQGDTIRAKIREWKLDLRHKKRRVRFPEGYKKSIIFYAGQGYEDWDGESDITKGIGGSEGMCIQMARELSKLGNKVYVYNSCGTSDGKVFEGVKYIDHRKWDPNLKCDVFFSLRRPDVFNRIIKATKTYLWLHDTDYGKQPLELMYAPNRVFVLTDFHKQIIKQNHGITDDSIFWVTRNALNKHALDYADKNAGTRDPCQVIYASSYDRGLINLLNIWPKIKAAVPQATLKIFYGTVTMDRMIEMRMQQGDINGANQMKQFKSQLFNMIAKCEGVQELGRISQDELYKKFAESGIWAYPTQFEEISCITAMQAQALGAVPVCTPFAALNETVGKYGIKAQLDKYADALIYALQNPDDIKARRKPMMEWARDEYDIVKLAQEWDHFLNID